METLSYFAEKHELNKFVNYYLAKETEDGLSELEDVTKDLNQIFVKLAQPMNEIINIENLYRNSGTHKCTRIIPNKVAKDKKKCSFV